MFFCTQGKNCNLRSQWQPSQYSSSGKPLQFKAFQHSRWRKVKHIAFMLAPTALHQLSLAHWLLLLRAWPGELLCSPGAFRIFLIIFHARTLAFTSTFLVFNASYCSFHHIRCNAPWYPSHNALSMYCKLKSLWQPSRYSSSSNAWQFRYSNSRAGEPSTTFLACVRTFLQCPPWT